MLAKARHDVLDAKCKEWEDYEKDVDELGDAIEDAKSALFDPHLDEKPLKVQHAVQDVRFVETLYVYYCKLQIHYLSIESLLNMY